LCSIFPKVRNQKLAKSISDVSWTSLVSKLRYKAARYGKEVISISRWFPSSQICSDCGHKDGKKPLHVRERICPVCLSHHDRDVNAAKNILAYTRVLAIQIQTGTAGIAW